MSIAMINVGFGNVIDMNRVVAITTPASSPTKRTILSAKEANKLIDMTNGRRNKAVVYMDSGHIILSALAPETLTSRFQTGKNTIVTKTEIGDENE